MPSVPYYGGCGATLNLFTNRVSLKIDRRVVRSCRQRLVGRQRATGPAPLGVLRPCPFLRIQLRVLCNVKYARIDADPLTFAERDSEPPVSMQDEATIDVDVGKDRIELAGVITIPNS